MSNDKKLPILPLRDVVIFPGMVMPLFVGREQSVKSIENAFSDDKQILVLTQKDKENNNPGADDLYQVGTVCKIMQMMGMPDGTLKILIEGEKRVKVNTLDSSTYLADATDFDATEENTPEQEQLAEEAMRKLLDYSNAVGNIAQEHIKYVGTLDEKPSELVGAIAAVLQKTPLEKRQTLLEIDSIADQLATVIAYMDGEIDAIDAQKKVQQNVRKQAESNQREYYLREQMKAIQKELGEDEDNEIEEFEERIKTAELTEAVREKAEKELRKLKNMAPQSAEANVVRNYLDTLLDFPWGKMSDVNYDLDKARDTLNSDHYGLEKVKEQVIENLAVQGRLEEMGLSDDAEADILCLVGPPGVGKTSICQSLAKATGREYVRMAVGGVRDEAEIRGHRRTYIGSKPGKIVEKLIDAKTQNPLFVIDEIDKMSSDPHRGDPSAAMLEVLDPEQNDSFEDHYLEVPIDLSKIKFVCTANDWGNIPRPLQDRMETVFLGSYTEDEKLEIAKQHLVRKQRKAHGLNEDNFKVEDDALRDLVRYYTKESGVRGLQREIKKMCRKAVVELAQNKDAQVTVTQDNLVDYAGKRKVKYELVEENDEVGLVTGLAYTSVGGETLPIEVRKTGKPGGKIIATGRLGEVMKESIQVAEGWMEAAASEGIIKDFSLDQLSKSTFRVHAPEGAVPKDGPSAGAAMLTGIFSAATGKAIRKDVAMTGELTLRGKVTAIGGVREKLSAAARGGYKTVIIPQDNVKDLDEVPQQVKDALEIKPVSSIEEVLKIALVDGESLFKPPANDSGAAQVPPTQATGGPAATAAPA